MKEALSEHLPSLLPIFEVVYESANTLWYNAFQEGLYKILSDNEFLQGCATGTFFFCVGAHKTFRRLRSLLNELKDILKAYIDDTTVCAGHPAACNFLRELRRIGPAAGLKLNSKKTVILLGKCSTEKEAHERRQTYASILGLRNAQAFETILLHPENALASSSPDSYGATLLGAPIGSPEYIKIWLEKKLSTFRSDIDKVVHLQVSAQKRWTLLHQSLFSQSNHVLRLLPPPCS